MIRQRYARMARSSTLIAIAVTFRDGLRFAPDAIGAFGDAVTLYQNKHPEKSMAAAEANVALLIAEARDEFGPWLVCQSGFGDQQPLPLCSSPALRISPLL